MPGPQGRHTGAPSCGAVAGSAVVGGRCEASAAEAARMRAAELAALAGREDSKQGLTEGAWVPGGHMLQALALAVAAAQPAGHTLHMDCRAGASGQPAGESGGAAAGISAWRQRLGQTAWWPQQQPLPPRSPGLRHGAVPAGWRRPGRPPLPGPPPPPTSRKRMG